MATDFLRRPGPAHDRTVRWLPGLAPLSRGATPPSPGREPRPARRSPTSGVGRSASSPLPKLGEEDRWERSPVATELRRALIESAGSMHEVYATMDVARSGRVDAAQFEAGLQRLTEVRGEKGLVAALGFPDVRTLFREFDPRGLGTISLRRLLEVAPAAPACSPAGGPALRRAPSGIRLGFGDTRTFLADYASRAALQQPNLARKPRWRDASPGDLSDSSAPSSPGAGGDLDEWAKQRRDLRRRLREYDDGAAAGNKWTLVSGLADPEKYDRKQKREKLQAVGQQRRIRGALQGCTQARGDLVGLQQAMRLVSEPPAPTKLQPPEPSRSRRRSPSPRVDGEVAALIRAARRQARTEAQGGGARFGR